MEWPLTLYHSGCQSEKGAELDNQIAIRLCYIRDCDTHHIYLNHHMSQPPRKKAKQVLDNIQRAEYNVTCHAHHGVRIVEQNIGQTGILAPAVVHEGFNVKASGGPSQD